MDSTTRDFWDARYAADGYLFGMAWALGPATLGMIGAVSLATPFLDAEYARRWFDWPGVLLTAQVPLLVLILGIGFFWTMRQRREVWPFLLSLGLFAVTFAGLGVSVYPYAVPDEITLWQAAAPASSQLFMLVGALILIPIILAYTAYAYWAVAHQQHPDQQFRIDRWPADGAVERREMRPQPIQLHEAVDGPQHVVGWHVPIQRELIEQGRLIDPPFAHHHCTSGLNDQSESAQRPHANCCRPPFSTKSARNRPLPCPLRLSFIPGNAAAGSLTGSTSSTPTTSPP